MGEEPEGVDGAPVGTVVGGVPTDVAVGGAVAGVSEGAVGVSGAFIAAGMRATGRTHVAVRTTPLPATKGEFGQESRWRV